MGEYGNIWKSIGKTLGDVFEPAVDVVKGAGGQLLSGDSLMDSGGKKGGGGEPMTYEKAEEMANESGEEMYSGEWWEVFDSAGSPDSSGSGAAGGANWWEKFGSALEGAGTAMGNAEKPGTTSRSSVTGQGVYQGRSRPARNYPAEILLQSIMGAMGGR